jgi:hypothetical protein
LGWITVATIANVTSVLDYLNWDGWGISPETWTMIMLGVGTGIGAAVGFTRHDTAYLLVLIWAFVGIGGQTCRSSHRRHSRMDRGGVGSPRADRQCRAAKKIPARHIIRVGPPKYKTLQSQKPQTVGNCPSKDTRSAQ